MSQTPSPFRVCTWFLLGILTGLAPAAAAQSHPMTIISAIRYDAKNLQFNTLDNENDNFGISATSLGDLDGDGVPDIAIGHKRDDDVDDPAKLGNGRYTNNGALWILFLNPDGTVKDSRKIGATSPDAPPLDGPNGEAGVRGFGQDVDRIGDLDGDGVDDLIVGVNEDDDGTLEQNCVQCSNPNLTIDIGYGAVFVLFMNSDGTIKDYQKISKTQGGANLGALLGIKDYFGASVASMGDFNDDGFPDILVGAPGTHKNNPTTGLDFPSPLAGSNGGNGDPLKEHISSTGLGRVWVLSLNPDGTVAKRVPIDMPRVGDPDPDNPGQFIGANQGLDGAPTNEYGDEFGRSVAWLGDLDGDTLDPDDPDDVDSMTTIAVGAPFDDDGPPEPQGRYGAVWILGLDLVGGVLKVVERQKLGSFDGDLNAGLSRRDLFGSSLAPAGDWNLDGVQDLAVGAMFDDDGKGDAGAVFILLLNRNGTVKSHFKLSDTPAGFPDPLISNQQGVNFGTSVANVGDWDGNGRNDFVVGAELYDSLNRGAAWLVCTDTPRMVLGDRLDAIVAPDNRYRFTFEATAGTQLKMTAIQRLSLMEPGLRILGPLVEGQEPAVLADLSDTVTTKNGPKAKRRSKLPKKLTVPETGEYLVEIVDVGGQGGAFRLKTRGKPAKDVRKVVATVAVDPDEGLASVPIHTTSAALLKKVTIKALKPKGDFAVIGEPALPSELLPAVDDFVAPNGSSVDITELLKVNGAGTAVSFRKIELDQLGQYSVEVIGSNGSVGYGTLKASVKIPRGRGRLVLP